jgi:hypothetical protein
VGNQGIDVGGYEGFDQQIAEDTRNAEEQESLSGVPSHRIGKWPLLSAKARFATTLAATLDPQYTHIMPHARAADDTANAWKLGPISAERLEAAIGQHKHAEDHHAAVAEKLWEAGSHINARVNEEASRAHYEAGVEAKKLLKLARGDPEQHQPPFSVNARNISIPTQHAWHNAMQARSKALDHLSTFGLQVPNNPLAEKNARAALGKSILADRATSKAVTTRGTLSQVSDLNGIAHRLHKEAATAHGDNPAGEHHREAAAAHLQMRSSPPPKLVTNVRNASSPANRTPFSVNAEEGLPSEEEASVQGHLNALNNPIDERGKWDDNHTAQVQIKGATYGVRKTWRGWRVYPLEGKIQRTQRNYEVHTDPTGQATRCTCPDNTYRGGVCKHMAAINALEDQTNDHPLHGNVNNVSLRHALYAGVGLAASVLPGRAETPKPGLGYGREVSRGFDYQEPARTAESHFEDFKAWRSKMAKGAAYRHIGGMNLKDQIALWQKHSEHGRAVAAREAASRLAQESERSEGKGKRSSIPTQVRFRPSMEAKGSPARPETEGKPVSPYGLGSEVKSGLTGNYWSSPGTKKGTAAVTQNLSAMGKEQWIGNAGPDDELFEFYDPNLVDLRHRTPQEGASAGFEALRGYAASSSMMAHEVGSVQAHRMAAVAHRMAAEAAAAGWDDSSNAQDWIGYHKKLYHEHMTAATEKMLRDDAFSGDEPEAGGYGHISHRGGPYRDYYDRPRGPAMGEGSLVTNSYEEAAHYANAALRASKRTLADASGKRMPGSLSKRVVRALELTRKAGKSGLAVDLNDAAKAQEEAGKEHRAIGTTILKHAPASDKAQLARGHAHLETAYHSEMAAEALHKASRDTVHNASPEDQMKIIRDMGKWEQAKMEKAHEVQARLGAGEEHPLAGLISAVQAAHDSVLAHSGKYSPNYLPTNLPTKGAAKYALEAARLAHEVGTPEAFEAAAKALKSLGHEHMVEAQDREASIDEFQGQQRGQYLRDARISARLNRAAAAAAFEAGAAHALHSNKLRGPKPTRNCRVQEILCNALLRKALFAEGVKNARLTNSEASNAHPASIAAQQATKGVAGGGGKAAEHAAEAVSASARGDHQGAMLHHTYAQTLHTQAGEHEAATAHEQGAHHAILAMARIPGHQKGPEESKSQRLQSTMDWLNKRKQGPQTKNRLIANQQLTVNALSKRSKVLGVLAHREFKATGRNPASWVKDEGKWEKAKKAAGSKYGGKNSSRYWAVVTHIYEQMHGRIKGRRGTHNALPLPPLPQSRAYQKSAMARSLSSGMVDLPHIKQPSYEAHAATETALQSGNPAHLEAAASAHEKVAKMIFDHPTSKYPGPASIGRNHLDAALAVRDHARSLKGTHNAGTPPSIPGGTSSSRVIALEGSNAPTRTGHGIRQAMAHHPQSTSAPHEAAPLNAYRAKTLSNHPASHAAYMASVRAMKSGKPEDHATAMRMHRAAREEVGGGEIGTAGFHHDVALAAHSQMLNRTMWDKPLGNRMAHNTSVETGIALHLARKALEAPGPKDLEKVRAAFVASGQAHANSSPETHTAAAEANEAAGNGKYSVMAAKVHRAIAAKGPQFWDQPSESYHEGRPTAGRIVAGKPEMGQSQQQSQE